MRTDLFFFRPPAYPAFIAAVTLGHPDRVAVVKVANALLGAAAAVLLAALSARIFRRRPVAIATGLAAALWPSLVFLCIDVQSEPLFVVLLLAAGFLLLAATDRPSSNLAVGAGLALGLAALTRSSALALVPVLAAPLWDRRYPFRARAHLAGSAALGLFVALAPWTLRNALVFHELIPVSDAGGFSLYQGNSSWTRRYYALKSRAEYDAWSREVDDAMRERLAAMENGGELSPAQRSEAFARMAVAESAADPTGSAILVAQKAWQWMRPYPTAWFWPPAVVIGVGLLYVLLDLTAILGFFRAPRPGVAAFCLAALVLSMLVHLVLQVLWRYRVPYWDPVLLLFGVFGLSTLLRKASAPTLD